MNPTSARLLNQQLICPRFTSPAEVVSWMGAVQAQDFRAARWAVAMRTRNPSFSRFEADFNAGRIIRVHLLRCTWQLISGEDLPWMLPLCSGKAKSALHGWMASNRIEISAKEEDRISGLFEEALSGGRSLTKEDMVAVLADRGISMDDHRLSYHLRLAELSGLICSGDLHPTKSSYSLTREKVGALTDIPKEEALARFAEKYFRSHSPATFEDFVWWSGLNTGDCRTAVQALGDRLRTERWKGRIFYLHEDCRARGFRKGTVHLLPPYDEYLIGYKSRDISLAPEFAHKAHNNSGIFKPIIAVDGKICGNWSPTSADGSIRFFINGTPEAEDAARQKFKDFRVTTEK